MSRFDVYVRQETCQYVTVEAKTHDDAMDVALSKAKDEVVWDGDPSYEVLAVEERK